MTDRTWDSILVLLVLMLDLILDLLALTPGMTLVPMCYLNLGLIGLNLVFDLCLISFRGPFQASWSIWDCTLNLLFLTWHLI